MTIIVMTFCLAPWSEPDTKQPPPQGKESAPGAQKSSNQENPSESFVTTQQLVDAISRAIEASAEKAKTSQNSPPPIDSLWWFQFWLVVFTAVLAGVGVFQAIIFFSTLKATTIAANAANESAQVAKDTLTSTQRAFVFLKDIELREIRGQGKKTLPDYKQTTWQLSPRWANSGDTCTRNLTISVGCYISSEGIPDSFNYPYINKELSHDRGLPYVSPQKDIPMMIGPKAEILSEPLILPTLIEVTSFIAEGHVHLYIFGEAKYNDIFDGTPEHCTRFCVKLFFTKQFSQAGERTPLMSFSYYGNYNCADED